MSSQNKQAVGVRLTLTTIRKILQNYIPFSKFSAARGIYLTLFLTFFVKTCKKWSQYTCFQPGQLRSKHIGLDVFRPSAVLMINGLITFFQPAVHFCNIFSHIFQTQKCAAGENFRFLRGKILLRGGTPPGGGFFKIIFFQNSFFPMFFLTF